MVSVLLPVILSASFQTTEIDVAAAANGGRVFADSEYVGAPDDTGGVAPASRLIDGIIRKKGDAPGFNRWHSALAHPHPHWIALAFARPARIHEVLFWRADVGFPVDVVGQYSPDHGRTIRTVFARSGMAADEDHPCVAVDFPPVLTDNLRITVTRSSNKQFPNYCQLSELQVMGSWAGPESKPGEPKREIGRMSGAPMPAGLSCRASEREIAFESPWFKIVFPTDRPGVTFLSVDASGSSRHDRNFLDDQRGIDLIQTGWGWRPTSSDVSFKLSRMGNVVRYSRIAVPEKSLWGDAVGLGTALFRDTLVGDLTFTVESKGVKVAFDAPPGGPFEGSPLRALFDEGRAVTTPLGRTRNPGVLEFPVLLHFADRGSLLVRCTEKVPGTRQVGKTQATWGFTGDRGARRMELALQPGLSVKHTELDMRAVEVYPEKKIVDSDPKLAGVRRGWLNIFGFRPDLPCLSNNVISDQCMFCMYEYADQARYTPPLFDDFTALDLVRTSLDFYFDGGFGYGSDDGVFQDTDPAMVIAAWDYAAGKKDWGWLRRRLPSIEKYANHIVACWRDGNGLPESTRHGISGSGIEGAGEWSSNWWDVVSFGGNDAYTNALDYRAFRCMADLERRCGRADRAGLGVPSASRRRTPSDFAAKAELYAAKARLIKERYFKSFYDPATGILAGWRSTDGRLHDYWFTFVNGIAISYGLVPRERGNAIMDRILAKMREVGYANFKIGLPGNLIPVALKDYAGGGVLGQPHKADGSDSFQSYENGGATGGFAYFTVQALYSLGRKADADRIFDAMLEGYRDGVFENGVGSGVDWKRWDGTPCGYEGLLTDSYYALTAFITGRLGRGVVIP